ncbi:hypothetical protein CEXT_242781 [Caerostris extrusa]|uniref:Uncharacterized protein n=1 Tax=Caerostris extrusa TaxID=172846 RepID=A0AAV4NW09_CAEEX|nr:hypothetical protein CEXT_242781 [Caerostris extrusa]
MSLNNISNGRNSNLRSSVAVAHEQQCQRPTGILSYKKTAYRGRNLKAHGADYWLSDNTFYSSQKALQTICRISPHGLACKMPGPKCNGTWLAPHDTVISRQI